MRISAVRFFGAPDLPVVAIGALSYLNLDGGRTTTTDYCPHHGARRDEPTAQ